MMSVWVVALEVVGWCLILTAALSLFSVIRTLRELIGAGKAEVIKPDLRRDAWEGVLFWPFYLLLGVSSATYQWTHGVLIWPGAAYAVLLAIWRVRSWFLDRNKGGEAGQAAGQP
jgi:hypothetical protein